MAQVIALLIAMLNVQEIILNNLATAMQNFVRIF